MVPGQNVSFTDATYSWSVPRPVATTMTLMPQTINGTVVASSISGNFTDYTVSLAPYDLLPMLAVQPGQPTVENNPSPVSYTHLGDSRFGQSTFGRSTFAAMKQPRVGLLSIGEEETKGNELTRESFQLLKRLPLNFVGNVEGRDLFNGHVDVIVADGFVGNVALKISEGVANLVRTVLKLSLIHI